MRDGGGNKKKSGGAAAKIFTFPEKTCIIADGETYKPMENRPAQKAPGGQAIVRSPPGGGLKYKDKRRVQYEQETDSINDFGWLRPE